MSGGPKELLDRIEQIDDTDYGDGPDDEFEDTEEEGGDDAGPDVDEPDEPEPTDPEPKQRRTKGKADDEEPPATAQERAEFRRLASGVHVDAKGNIVDPRDGTIIARAGSERRLFEKNMRSSTQLTEVNAQNEQLKNQLQQMQYLDSVPKRFNLEADEVKTALALAAVYKQNPVEAARNMVEMVLALGHNVTDILGTEAGNALEMGAVRQMIEERLAPVVQPVQQQQEQAERRKAAERQLQQFVSDHEHSDTHLVVLDRMIGENPDLTPEKAYYELKLFCARRGLDFTQPLQPQLAALAQRQNGGTQTQPAPRRASLPNGRQAASAQRSVDEPVFADPGLSWSDIIKSSM